MPVKTWAGRLMSGIAITVAIAACAGASTPSGSSTAPDSGAPSASTPAASGSAAASLGAAAQQFSRLSDDLTIATEELNRSLSENPTPDALRQAYTTYAALLERAVDELEAIEFPTDVQPDVDTLRETYTTLSAAFEDLANEPQPEWPSEVEGALTESIAAMSRLRVALGLPPATF